MHPQIFLVGGAVRDEVLGKEPKDRDFVVVGADIQWMLAQGFKQVGAAFPVFLHPETGEEYALARREKKVAPGYKGFEFEFGPHISLKDDLLRRDLTINSMAKDIETGEIFDFFGGKSDLEWKIIRHTSPAFAEDPLRVLRVARFAARYGFSVADETLDLCEQLVAEGELDALSSNRIWSELEKLFAESHPEIGLKILHEVGALFSPKLVKLFSRELVLDLPKSIKVEELNFDEKIFSFVSIESMTATEIDEAKIPLHHVKLNKFFIDLFQLLELHDSKHFAEQILVFFKNHREEIKNVDLIKAFVIFNVKTTEFDTKVLSTCVKAFDALLSADLTEITRGVPAKEIKDRVKEAQMKIIENSLKKSS